MMAGLDGVQNKIHPGDPADKNLYDLPPGVSYIPRDFMPTKRFSTRSRRPMPCLRSEEHTSELQSLMRISYAVFCLNNKNDHDLIYNQTPRAYHKLDRHS